MRSESNTVLPLVEYCVEANRSGLGVVSLGYLPGLPPAGLSEAEARKAISFTHFAVTEQACDQLVALLTELRARLADAKSARN
jgi:hypothetical protein